MNPAKPQQPADGQRDDSEDLIAELARMMGTGAQGKQPQSSEEGKTAEPPAAPVAQPTPSGPTTPLRIPGEGGEPAAPAAGFRFDFNVPKTAAVTPPEPLVNWQERLKRGNAPASSVRLEPTLERVPVEPEAAEPSFVAPPVSETPRAPEPEPEPEPEALAAETAAPDNEHDAIADLIAAELDAEIPHQAEEPAAPEEAPEPPHEQTLSRTNYTARPVPEEDRFASPPVFGVGTRAADIPPSRPQEPQADRPLDPMDEIESLIGAAIQNDPGIRQVVAPPSAPAPSMASAAPATDFAADDQDDDAAHEAAEAAILAAAAATGVEVSRVAAESRFQAAADMADEPPRRVRRERPALRLPGFRPFIGPLVAGVFLVLAGFGLYWVLGMGHGDGTTAPVLTADSTPAKQAPATPPAATTPPAASAVFNELDGKVPTAADEQLVSRDQSTGAEVPPAATSNDEGDGLANRKVRTVTVRPDGTIVNADDALAGAEILPVERPNVPDVPNGNLDNSDLLTAAAQPPAATPPANPGATADATAPGATPPAANDEFANAPIDPNAPVPMPRPADRSTLLQPSAQLASNGAANDLIGNLAAADATQQGQQPAAANNSQQQASTGGSSPPAAYVQLSSQRDQNVAQQSLIGINQRYGKLLKGILPEVQRVDLGSRGIYYRVRVPTDSLNSANYLCSQIKTAGGDCIVTN